METQIQPQNNLIIPEWQITKENNPFIEANTKAVELKHLKNDCTIPVFSKDNECTIAHHEFIEATLESVKSVYTGHNISQPDIRTSHIIKGRIPTAIGKPVKELLPHEKTIYYERAMFKIDIPNITADINGNMLNLVVAGVRAYNKENLYSKKSLEKFTVCIGFKNMVCCNMCVSSDGSVAELRVSNVEELQEKIIDVIGNYEMQKHLKSLEALPDYKLTDKQFAQFIGRCRLYQYLPKHEKKDIPELLLNDGQISAISKGYYEDENFCRDTNGDISLWQVYNLITAANKSSYIDRFINRSVNSHELIQNLAISLKSNTPNWFLN